MWKSQRSVLGTMSALSLPGDRDENKRCDDEAMVVCSPFVYRVTVHSQVTNIRSTCLRWYIYSEEQRGPQPLQAPTGPARPSEMAHDVHVPGVARGLTDLRTIKMWHIMMKKVADLCRCRTLVYTDLMTNIEWILLIAKHFAENIPKNKLICVKTWTMKRNDIHLKNSAHVLYKLQSLHNILHHWR